MGRKYIWHEILHTVSISISEDTRLKCGGYGGTNDWGDLDGQERT